LNQILDYKEWEIEGKLRCMNGAVETLGSLREILKKVGSLGFLHRAREKAVPNSKHDHHQPSIEAQSFQNFKMPKCTFLLPFLQSEISKFLMISLETRQSRSRDQRSLRRSQNSHPQNLRRGKQRTPVWPCPYRWNRTLSWQNHRSNGEETDCKEEQDKAFCQIDQLQSSYAYSIHA